MKNPEAKPRRVFRLQARKKYMGTEPGPAEKIWSLCVPRDVAESAGLARGDKFRFHRGRGGKLVYEPMGDECPRCGRSPPGEAERAGGS